MWKYNKGEWSEIYTFSYILSSGVLYAADKDLNKVEEVYFPIIRIIREEVAGQPIDYKPGDVIRIYKGDDLLKEVDKSEFEKITQTLLDAIPLGSRAFEITEAEEFFESVYCSKHTGISHVCGFSIKSYLGANPTLINPGSNTNFTFSINNCSDAIMDEVNGINTRKKLIDKMNCLLEHGCKFDLVPHSISAQFEENL